MTLVAHSLSFCAQHVMVGAFACSQLPSVGFRVNALPRWRDHTPWSQRGASSASISTTLKARTDFLCTSELRREDVEAAPWETTGRWELECPRPSYALHQDSRGLGGGTLHGTEVLENPCNHQETKEEVPGMMGRFMQIAMAIASRLKLSAPLQENPLFRLADNVQSGSRHAQRLRRPSCMTRTSGRDGRPPSQARQSASEHLKRGLPPLAFPWGPPRGPSALQSTLQPCSFP